MRLLCSSFCSMQHNMQYDKMSAMLILSTIHTSMVRNNNEINSTENRSHKDLSQLISQIILYILLARFSCSAVRIYDGGNIGSNFVKCYECCFPLHNPALITKMLAPDGIRTKMNALYNVIRLFHCYIELFATSRVPHGFHYMLY